MATTAHRFQCVSLPTGQLLKIDALALLRPGVGQSPCKTGDGKISRRSALNDRRDDPRRHEGEGCQQPNVPFNLAFLSGDLCEGCNSTLPEVVDPLPCLGDGAE